MLIYYFFLDLPSLLALLGTCSFINFWKKFHPVHLFRPARLFKFSLAWPRVRWKKANKGLIYLALVDPQEFFQQHLMKKEEQPSFGKRYSVHFGEESALLLFPWADLSSLSESVSANLGTSFATKFWWTICLQRRISQKIEKKSQK